MEAVTEALGVWGNLCKKAEREKQKAEAESLGDAPGDEAAAGKGARKRKQGVLCLLSNILEEQQ